MEALLSWPSKKKMNFIFIYVFLIYLLSSSLVFAQQEEGIPSDFNAPVIALGCEQVPDTDSNQPRSGSRYSAFSTRIQRQNVFLLLFDNSRIEDKPYGSSCVDALSTSSLDAWDCAFTEIDITVNTISFPGILGFGGLRLNRKTLALTTTSSSLRGRWSCTISPDIRRLRSYVWNAKQEELDGNKL